MDTVRLRRFAHRTHRWLGLIVGLQVFVWLAGGFVMTALPIERVRGEHRVAETPALAIDAGAVIPFEVAASAAGADRVASGRLTDHLGGPAWQIEATGGAVTLIDAVTGVALSPLGQDAAMAVALGDYTGPGVPMAIRRFDEPPTEYGRPGPVWQVVFDDLDRTTLYIAIDTGEVRARRSRTWRSFDLAWRLHVMDWDDGATFNHPLVQAFAGAGTLFALSGLTLIWLRLRQRHCQRGHLRRRA